MKIATSNLDKLLTLATSKEIDIYIYISQFQNAYGKIHNVNFPDTKLALGISKSKFYYALQSMERKGLIKVDWSTTTYNCYTIILVDNEPKKIFEKNRAISTQILHSYIHTHL